MEEVALPIILPVSEGDLASPGALGDVPGSEHCANKTVSDISLQPVLLNHLPHEGGRVIVVGDTHGCFDEFKELLAQLDVNPEKDTVIIIGDIVNKGPESANLLRYIIANRGHILALRGNHEDGALAVIESKRGGITNKLTSDPGWDWVDGLTGGEIQWLRDLPLTMVLQRLDVILVHAGLIPFPPFPLGGDPTAELVKQEHVVQTKLRIFVDDPKGTGQPGWVPYESNWKVRPDRKAKTPGQPWPKFVSWFELWKHNSHVIFGHDARKMLQLGRWATGIDTGCYQDDKNSRLTAMVLGVDGRGRPYIPSPEFLQERRETGCRPDEGIMDLPNDRPGVLFSIPKIRPKSTP